MAQALCQNGISILRLISVVSKTLATLLKDFQTVLDTKWRPSLDLEAAAASAIDACTSIALPTRLERERELIALVNAKFKLNRNGYQSFLDYAASQQIYFNYHDKAELSKCFDFHDGDRFLSFLRHRNLPLSLKNAFQALTKQESLLALSKELSNPKIRRKDARDCDPEERRESIFRALFGGYIFRSLGERAMHQYFNADCRIEYKKSFYDHLKHFHPGTIRRDCALAFAVVDPTTLTTQMSKDGVRNAICNQVRELHSRLANYCFLGILIEPAAAPENEDLQWRLFSDIVIFAERFKEVPLKATYFRPTLIEGATAKHIPGLDSKVARFDLANEGFLFKDCFILPKGVHEIATGSAPGSLLLLFEKSERDETPVPCPACRSVNVAGNSYPSLGVRSWECQNPICPSRSAFDRGNRYSVQALLKQEAIDSEVDQISEGSLRKWKLDVVSGVTERQVAEMLVQHFSLHGDQVLFLNTQNMGPNIHGREIRYEQLSSPSSKVKAYDEFVKSSFFDRWLIKRPFLNDSKVERIEVGLKDVQLYRGDCFDVLGQLPEESVDGAVTSPPYYNARSYSQWPNIYCYFYDMYNSARQVYRVLKPGAVYLFNVFDYFDNENTVVFSSMGKKRMVLGATFIYLFRKIGFRLQGNIAWYKGEIEGKRNFNQGNKSPYYQFPFNCWEHIFVLVKPGRKCRYTFPTILAAKPVVKMVRGENILGHSAPFPPQLPALLIDQMRTQETVLDPYAGSMTTARVARAKGVRSISIELSSEYCSLGVRLLKQDDMPLFSTSIA